MRFQIRAHDDELKDIKKIVAYARLSEENMKKIFDMMPIENIRRRQRTVYARNIREAELFRKLASLPKYSANKFNKIVDFILEEV